MSEDVPLIIHLESQTVKMTCQQCETWIFERHGTQTSGSMLSFSLFGRGSGHGCGFRISVDDSNVRHNTFDISVTTWHQQYNTIQLLINVLDITIFLKTYLFLFCMMSVCLQACMYISASSACGEQKKVSEVTAVLNSHVGTVNQKPAL